MKNNSLYNIMDLIEEIGRVDKMIEIHKNAESSLMLSQYNHQKLKLSGFLFKELLSNSDNKSDVMRIIKLFIEKFYSSELNEKDLTTDNRFKQIEDLVS